MRFELTALLALSHLKRIGDPHRHVPMWDGSSLYVLNHSGECDSVSSCHTYPRSMDLTSV